MKIEERFPFFRIELQGTDGGGEQFEICATCGAPIWTNIAQMNENGSRRTVSPMTLHNDWHERRGE